VPGARADPTADPADDPADDNSTYRPDPTREARPEHLEAVHA